MLNRYAVEIHELPVNQEYSLNILLLKKIEAFIRIAATHKWAAKYLGFNCIFSLLLRLSPSCNSAELSFFFLHHANSHFNQLQTLFSGSCTWKVCSFFFLARRSFMEIPNIACLFMGIVLQFHNVWTPCPRYSYDVA